MVEAWHAITLTCQAIDPDQDVISYTWRVSDGDLISQDGQATYGAPDRLGLQTITVQVQDEHGGQATSQIQVRVIEALPSPGQSEPIGDLSYPWHQQIRVRRKLGWAIGLAGVTFAAQELFERGSIFWRQDLKLGYVVTQDGAWQAYPIIDWPEGQDEYSCPNVSSRQTPPTPKRGIGKLWCEKLGGPTSTIGWALAEEQGYEAHWQNFEHGLIWRGHDGWLYILYQDGTMESFTY